MTLYFVARIVMLLPRVRSQEQFLAIPGKGFTWTRHPKQARIFDDPDEAARHCFPKASPHFVSRNVFRTVGRVVVDVHHGPFKHLWRPGYDEEMRAKYLARGRGMIVCEKCAQANALEGTPVKGFHECPACGGAGQNCFVEVPEFTAAHAAKAKEVREQWAGRMLDAWHRSPKGNPPSN